MRRQALGLNLNGPLPSCSGASRTVCVPLRAPARVGMSATSSLRLSPCQSASAVAKTTDWLDGKTKRPQLGAASAISC
ncbi:hypothetical protein Srot_1834 [Segniliparus rotundus DSM 44985]|uniref:Uncharacterized protein n=1 Tax=Segniliparus rotundus (strain ATCC BAA-972 / CDC 1076 / CIP 108378 / DSM 44985 / JCM 13578) TaxID=640132 RepID=D6Z8L4_SEGRD|nr:hypothetical protein Srot_1834 [Segniliparus rotundus DSM 44985]